MTVCVRACMVLNNLSSTSTSLYLHGQCHCQEDSSARIFLTSSNWLLFNLFSSIREAKDTSKGTFKVVNKLTTPWLLKKEKEPQSNTSTEN